MSEEILNKIVAERKAIIDKVGVTFGVTIPSKRTRGVYPFPAGVGAIMEIKRASPSKGIIDANLDPKEQAKTYITAGAVGISVLTETEHFKGSLLDLIDVANVAEKTPVLRKDFLLSPAEIDVAYRCGADSVLLIARILNTETLLKMVATCLKLGVTPFIEVHEQDDLSKLSLVMRTFSDFNGAVGVNCRNLQDFSMDALYPAILPVVDIVQNKARTIYESGVHNKNGAAFARSLGYDAILVGEAVVRDNSIAKSLSSTLKASGKNKLGDFWAQYAKRLRNASNKHIPLVKICGITKLDDAIIAHKAGASLLGFIFSSKTKRPASQEVIRAIKGYFNKNCSEATRPLLIGVITDPESAEGKVAIALSKEGVLDAVQYHGDCALSIPEISDVSFAAVPRYPAISLKTVSDVQKIKAMQEKGFPRVLVDGATGGGGVPISQDILLSVQKMGHIWLAGGINPTNVAATVQKWQPELLDVSSGVEFSPGIKDADKIKLLFKSIYVTLKGV